MSTESSFPEFRFLDPGALTDDELSLLLVRTYPHHFTFDIVPGYEFQMLRTREGQTAEIAGQIRFRLGKSTELEQYYGHIGYSVAPEHRGHHFAERSVRLLLPLARRHGLQELWITCTPDNIASRRTCERLEAILVNVVDVPPENNMYQRGERQKCRYRISL